MNYLFCTSNKINGNNENQKCEIFSTGGVKENGGILLVFLNMGAAPSSGGQILHRAKTINLMNLEWNGMEWNILNIMFFLDCVTVDLLNLLWTNWHKCKKTILQNGTIKVELFYLHRSQTPPSS